MKNKTQMFHMVWTVP